ncbi:ABC-type sugar transport system ATPase subunit [Rhodobium orientis]|uniref:ABC transporter n=1 Tax=Rhodobium orientis TaxID=34017 RepID=A0A327JS90_9HYPH|nr:ABC transporter ATP-binding protein [Rhodobium orientis]MBB4303535.1 ABC-type sugar transport system ATPase subunit [Rhodobium orientis]MBK5950465.1 ABC transporter [Rhodobium orientis]RAI28314.1 ABC transporter [Rhodobium orientis]
MSQIELRHVDKSFGAVGVCHDINLTVEEGEFVTLLGSSGCGKTTTLNMVAGLEDPSKGDILIGGRRVNDLSPVQRDVAMVFQNYALYPHMTVAENLGFTLKMRKMAKPQIAERVAAVAASLELTPLLERLPSALSGGQQQRVAIGRALVREPRVFLFDEPFSNLDASLRVKMRAEVKQLHQQLGVTTLFVTHDQEEAMSISDRIAVLNRGKVEQFGTPEEIYSRPATRYVARFIGNPQIDLVPGELEPGADGAVLRLAGVALTLPDFVPPPGAGPAVEVGVRPEHVRLTEAGIPAKVQLVQPVGAATHVVLGWEGGDLIASVPGFVHLSVGAAIHFEIDPRHVLVFDAQSGDRLM